MKRNKSIFTLGLVVAMLFAFCLPVAAIGFDAETVYESVFVIVSGNALGSGFAVGENCILTNAHVIEDKRDVTIYTYDGDDFDAQVLCMDEDLDIAVLAVDRTSTPLPLQKLEDVSIGEDVWAIGAPESLDYTLTRGVVSAKEREINGQKYIQTDAAINHGNSGGPLMDDDGNVIGMNTLKLSEAEGIGLAIPVDRICDYMQKQGIPLTDGGNVDGVVGELTPVDPTDPGTEDGQDEGGSGTDSGNGFDGFPWGEGTPFDYRDLLKDTSPMVILVAAGATSVIIGVGVLVLCLTTRKKKKKEKPQKTLLYMVPGQEKPDEVPDFDIEFLE